MILIPPYAVPDHRHHAQDGRCGDHGPLVRAATRIVNDVKGIDQLVYVVTSNPPGTIKGE